MAAPATVGERRTRRRRIIERPRLLALLDESAARVKALVATAGYGKTTLAEQWVGKDGRRGAWYAARPSSSDVAALALGLARAASEIVPECDARLREHLRALPAPADNVTTLAELLGEDLGEWPAEAWLVLDDYHELVGTADAERFVEHLVVVSPVQMLITSRQRPTWITARHMTYGETFEVNQRTLAMDEDEATEVLSERDPSFRTGLLELAGGWPAVIGLASVSTAEIERSPDVPESLYRFFAEEVFNALHDAVQEGLATLVLSPEIDRMLASRLLGAEDVEPVCEAALDVGILVERGAQLHMHPLARAYLEDRLDRIGVAPDTKTLDICIRYFGERRNWDAAFDLIVRHHLEAELGPLLEDALDELLETARLSTVESWCEHAERSSAVSPIISLGRAEVELRRGHLAAAQSYAELVASQAKDLEFRALFIAGRAAHLASREEEALELFRRAEESAPSDALRREASWGQVMCLIDLDDPGAADALDVMVTGVRLDNAREAVRAASLRLHGQTRFGGLDLADADRAVQLLSAVSDPLVESSFLNAYSTTLAMVARYGEARATATTLLDMLDRYRLSFAVPFALCAAGLADAGLRNWKQANRELDEALDHARMTSNAHAEGHCIAAHIRTLAQQGRHDLTLALVHEQSLRPDPQVSPLHAELAATGAFAHAAAGNLEDALRAIDPVRSLSSAVEATVLVAAVDAIVGLKRHDTDAIERIDALVDTAFSTGALDLLVTAYRSTPELLAVLLRTASSSNRVRDLVKRIGDDDLARAVGYEMTAQYGSTQPLTPRQSEVHELLRQGLTNREIARLLYIEEATVKLHVQHVFDRLGVRSRKTIAMRAALERSAQATSAIEDTGIGSDS